ncbi:hypothetical protein BDY19DRAFT_944255 [Irpex rosettiformis]|uniref:Uncharacterized protein n=1 Tax=Irpex rosettiformis TaxID=378272 RepID=A0ACB8U429_9APHY|nr:hypothetical protein BDY19DRAFT_944255 [Irpex rosettiformis]
MRVFAAVLALATSTFALSITAPTNATGFSNSGQNTVSWTRVSTDPQNFTIVLVNKSVFPNTEQVLSALVDAGATGGTIQVNPPSTGWPQSGTGFQINLAADAQHLDSLLAQSDQFTFHAPDSSSSVSASGSSASGTSSVSRTVLSISQTPAATGSGAASNPSGNAPSSTSDTTTSPTPNGATSFSVQAAFFGVVALAGAYLA